jgi:uncharacterized membrane protein HdeD (DUF308 family)
MHTALVVLGTFFILVGVVKIVCALIMHKKEK